MDNVQAPASNGGVQVEGTLSGLPERWGATLAEADAAYPCDELRQGDVHVSSTCQPSDSSDRTFGS